MWASKKREKLSKRERLGNNEGQDFKPLARKWKGDIDNRKSVDLRSSDDSKPLKSQTDSCDRPNNFTSTIEFCPMCQFPFKYLVGQNREWHTMDCLASSKINRNTSECSLGLKCNSISQDHYRRYLHCELAAMRSKTSNIQVMKCSTSSSNCTQRSPNPPRSTDSSIEEYCNEDDGKRKQENLNLSSNSTIDNTSLDKDYKEILSEIIDELEDCSEDGIVCETTTLMQHDKPSCLKIPNENSYENVANLVECCRELDNKFSNQAVPNTKTSADVSSQRPNESPFENPESSSESCSKSSSSEVKEARALLQTGLDSYFGIKSKRMSSGSEKELGKPSSGAATRAIPTIGSKQNPAVVPKSSHNASKKRVCPFYKKIPGTSITVDAFSYGSIPGCTAYFLSHFHYDHYGGLNRSFNHDMYCSKVTAALVRTQIKVSSRYIHELPMHEEIELEGVKVTLLDANHCPGSVMFLFAFPGGKKILHTGDFRAVPLMCDYSALKNMKIHTIYLDTTYCHPSYNFPTQQSTIDFAVEKSLRAVQLNPKTLIVCGTYSVGKERVFVSIAKALNCMISANANKRRILTCLDWRELEERLTADWSRAQIHVLPMNSINVKALTSHLKSHKEYKEVLAFKPTGWTYNSGLTDLRQIRPTVSGPVVIYGVPYSEHSSFSELESFIKHFMPERILPTVNNGSYKKRDEMQKIFSSWLSSKR